MPLKARRRKKKRKRKAGSAPTDDGDADADEGRYSASLNMTLIDLTGSEPEAEVIEVHRPAESMDSGTACSTPDGEAEEARSVDVEQEEEDPNSVEDVQDPGGCEDPEEQGATASDAVATEAHEESVTEQESEAPLPKLPPDVSLTPVSKAPAPKPTADNIDSLLRGLNLSPDISVTRVCNPDGQQTVRFQRTGGTPSFQPSTPQQAPMAPQTVQLGQAMYRPPAPPRLADSSTRKGRKQVKKREKRQEERAVERSNSQTMVPPYPNVPMPYGPAPWMYHPAMAPPMQQHMQYHQHPPPVHGCCCAGGQDHAHSAAQAPTKSDKWKGAKVDKKATTTEPLTRSQQKKLRIQWEKEEERRRKEAEEKKKGCCGGRQVHHCCHHAAPRTGGRCYQGSSAVAQEAKKYCEITPDLQSLLDAFEEYKRKKKLTAGADGSGGSGAGKKSKKKKRDRKEGGNALSFSVLYIFCSWRPGNRNFGRRAHGRRREEGGGGV